MSKLSVLLDRERGTAAALVRHLRSRGVKASRQKLSWVKNGNANVSPHWYEGIVDFFNGEISYKDLLPKPRARS